MTMPHDTIRDTGVDRDHDRDFYADGFLRGILEETQVIAIVGASANPARPSFEVMRFLKDFAYNVIPVNPGHAGKEILGETVYATLAEIPIPIDMVDIFRASDAVEPIVDQAIAVNVRTIWMQLGVVNEAAAEKAEASGCKVVMNRCPKIEIPRLGIASKLENEV